MSKRAKRPIAGSDIPKHPSKQPRTARGGAPLVERTPRALNNTHEDIQQRCPSWRFADLDAEWPSGVASLDVKNFRDLHAKLGALETQKLCEIWANGAHNHEYAVEDLPRPTLRRLEEICRDDETALHSLRLNGRFRVIGVLREHIFYVLWIDPEHEVWPSKPKHT